MISPSPLACRLVACEDLLVDRMQARVEIPSEHAVYNVTVMKSNTVRRAMSQVPINLTDIEQVTYDGEPSASGVRRRGSDACLEVE